MTQVLGTFGRTQEHEDLARALVAGAARCSFALSEPDGGTDVARVMQTTATADGDGWRIEGQKMWTSGATMASHVVVLARTSPIERSPVHGVTMFLVPTDAPGVTVRTIDTFGIHGLSTCEVFLDDVTVSGDAVLGEADRGMRQVFATINREGLNAAAACIGAGRGALELAVAYAQERQVFGKAIGSFQTPQHWLVDGAVALESARGLMGRAAEVEVAGGDAAILASMAKLVASEAVQADHAARDAAHGRDGIHPGRGDAALLPGRAPVELLAAHQRDGAQPHRRTAPGPPPLVLTTVCA